MNKLKPKQKLISQILLVCLTFISCSTTQKRTGQKNETQRTSKKVSLTQAPVLTAEREQTELREIQKLYSQAQLDGVLQRTATFEKRHPKSAISSSLYNYRGLCFLAQRKPLAAIQAFQKSLETNTQKLFENHLAYNLAVSYFEAGFFNEIPPTLQKVTPDELDPETRLKFYLLRAKVALKKNQLISALTDAVSAGESTDAGFSRQAVDQLFKDILAVWEDPLALEPFSKERAGKPMGDLILFRLASLQQARGQFQAAEESLTELKNQHSSSTKLLDSRELERSLQERRVIDKKAIGVLLPLKGKFARFGARALKGIELAFRVFNTEETGSPLTLVLEDAGEEPEQAIRALEHLFFKHHVAAVIGPLLSKGVDLVSRRAQELGLPLITLSQQPGLTGDYVFAAGLTPKVQAQEIARYAIEKLKLSRFAILHPKDKFGEQFSQSFWDSIESFGGQIVGIESYAPGETDFRTSIDRLTGIHYLDARQRELDAMAKIREENSIKKKTRKTELFFNLPPIVDFQAVFIPDDPKVIGQILPTFSYRDVEGMRFLGVSTWNSPELVTRAQHHVEGAVFLDAFFLGSSSPSIRKFVDRYTQTFAQEPGVIEAISYDAAAVLEQIASQEYNSREEIRDQLKTVKGFPGVTGQLSFIDGSIDRKLTILSIKNNSITEILTP